MNKLKIEYVPIGSIKKYERNAKLHPAEQVEQIKKSIEEFGFNDPIAVWHGTIVEGHGRLMAAEQIGMTVVPVIRLDELTDEQRRAYMLVHNKTTMNSGFDDDLLKLEISELDEDMTVYGFDLLETEEVREDDYEPVLPEEPKSKIGDLYQLGRHRLLVGDSTVLKDVQQLVGDSMMDMLLTDPPYNVNYEGAAGKIQNDNMQSSVFREFLRSSFCNAKSVLKMGGAFHVWYGENESYNFRGALKEAGLQVRQQLVWIKSQATLGRQDFQHMYESVLAGDSYLDDEMEESGYEPCLYGWKDGAGHKWYKKRKERDVLFFDKPMSSAEHPTMKPVLLFDYEMKCNTKPGDNILDLFAGSGTAIIAAEPDGRNAFCMEFDPKYADVIVDRWERFTGEKAILLEG